MKRKISRKLNNPNSLNVYYRPVVFLLLLLGAQITFAEPDTWQIIKSGQFQGLANASGEILIPPVYDAIGWSNGDTNVINGVIGFKEANHWGIISLRNKRLTKPEFTILTPFDTERIKAAIKGKFSNHLFYGILDYQGEIRVEFRFFSIEYFKRDLLRVSEYKNRSVAYGLIDGSGQSIVANRFDSIEPLGYLILAGFNNKWMLFGLSGTAVFDFWLDTVISQDEGFLVSREGKFGFVDQKGATKYSVQYKRITRGEALPFNQWKLVNPNAGTETLISCDSLTYNSNGSWTVHINDFEYLFDLAVNRVFSDQENILIEIYKGHLLMQNAKTQQWSIYREDGTALVTNKDQIILDTTYYYVRSEDRWDVFNYYGRQINERTVEDVLGEQDKKIGVKNHGYWGWLDFSGHPVIRYKYDAVSFGLQKDQFIMRYIGHWGVANFEDAYVIPPDYQRIEIQGGHYVCHKGQAKYIFSKVGKLLYQTAGEVIGDQLLMIKDEYGWGAVLPEGNVISPYYDSIKVVNGFYQFKKQDHVMLLKGDGEMIINLADEVHEVLDYSEDWFLVEKEGSYGFMDTLGRLRIANRYEHARSFSDGLAAIKLIGKWGFIDKDEKLRVQPFYDFAEDFQDALAVVGIGGKYGIINEEGNEVVSLTWNSIECQSTGNFVVQDESGNYGLVDTDGGIILSPTFQNLSDQEGSLVVVGRNLKKGILNYQGYTIYPFKYDDIRICGGNVLLLDKKMY